MDVKTRVESWLLRLRNHGFEVYGIPLSIHPPSPALSWNELDRRWKSGDRELLGLYEGIATAVEGYDVFVNCNGVNLHPEFVQQLSLYKVYACFDDPESSGWLSRPVAASYDLAMVGNIACLDMYRGWGVKEVRWWPIGFHPNDCDPELTREKILSGERDIELSLLCERIHNWRDSKLEKFTSEFPNGTYFGKGWPNGFLPENQRVPLLQRTKIGPNFHNSTGPVNSRTYVLPANGVLQVCDNKNHLGKIFELGKEAVGFDTVPEAVDLCRYYLSHDRERREIAAAGWERVHRDYNEIAVFNMLVEKVRALKPLVKSQEVSAKNALTMVKSQRNKTFLRRIISRIRVGIGKLLFR